MTARTEVQTEEFRSFHSDLQGVICKLSDARRKRKEKRHVKIVRRQNKSLTDSNELDGTLVVVT